MPHPDLAVVTGAFSYTGRYVTRRLLDEGVRVRTLTRSPDAEDPLGGRVEVAPMGLFPEATGSGLRIPLVTSWARFSICNSLAYWAIPV